MGMEKEQSKEEDIRGKKAKPMSYNLDLLPRTGVGSNLTPIQIASASFLFTNHMYHYVFNLSVLEMCILGEQVNFDVRVFYM